MIASELDEVTPALENLEIWCIIHIRWILEAKKSLIKEKTLGSNGFAPEVPKYCDLDDIALSYVNKLLVGEKPDQWYHYQSLEVLDSQATTGE